MIAKALRGLFCVLVFCAVVNGEDKNNVPRGTYPFMAFIYYSDEAVVDSTGNRFVRGAVLIRNDWLVSSAMAPGEPDGFPRKTLLARAGAIAIDANFTLNEDEYEQEREIIQIIRPYNQSATEWWRTDISLMKTLRPFNNTSAVSIYAINYDHMFLEKTCFVLVYVRRFGNWTKDKILMKMYVEMLPSTMPDCGSHFISNTMACAADSDENKHDTYGSDFCQGNSGGPLICETEIMGLQTYIGNDCKPPHLYQLLTAWKKFISCGIEDKCQEQQCAKVCHITNKDAAKAPAPVVFVEKTPITTELLLTPELNASENTIFDTTASVEGETIEEVPSVVPTLTTTKIVAEEAITETTGTTITMLYKTITTKIPKITTTKHFKASTAKQVKSNIDVRTTQTELTEEDEDSTETKVWPKEKTNGKKVEDLEKERETNVEHQELKDNPPKKHKSSSSAVDFNELLVFFTIMCLI